jgi:hypothetical protein
MKLLKGVHRMSKATKVSRANKCKTPKCERAKVKLDVCESCYSVVYRAIQRGQLTWDEAEKRGLVGPAKRVRSPMRDLLKTK